MENNWDLHAVVRGCATIASTTTTTTTSSVSSSSSVFSTSSSYQQQQQQQQQQHSASSPPSSSSSSCGFFSMMILPNSLSEQKSNQIFSFSNSNNNYPFEAGRISSTIDEELHELCKPFFLKSSHPNIINNFHSFQNPSSCSSSSFSYSSSPNSVQAQQKQSSTKNPHHHHAGSAITTPRSKRRKNQVKKVCEVAAENLSSDIWAWRKYGQKPIKGSPYPRGYYRCSSSKGCLARKQVERNRTDPTMFVVTYTGEHNHPAPTQRNSLAGSTRQKQPQTNTEDIENKALIRKQASTPSSITEEEEEHKSESELLEEDKMEDFLMMVNDDGDDNDEFGSPDMEITDDFFEGLDELTGSSPSSSSATANNGECFGVAAIPSLVAK